MYPWDAKVSQGYIKLLRLILREQKLKDKNEKRFNY